MIFEYDELKECVRQDFERFYQMGFNEKQIIPAVINEYEHGEDFSQVENICILVSLALSYKEYGFNYDAIVKKIEQLIIDNVVENELGREYTKFISDLTIITNN